MTAEEYKALLGCDEVRIIRPGGQLFLLAGWRRNTKDDEGQWARGGEPIDFDYLAERCVGRGRTDVELEESVRRYARLRELLWEEDFDEILELLEAGRGR